MGQRMTREYWNEGYEQKTQDKQQPISEGVLKSLVTLLGLVLAMTLYMLPDNQRLLPIVFLALGSGLIWLAYGLRPRRR